VTVSLGLEDLKVTKKDNYVFKLNFNIYKYKIKYIYFEFLKYKYIYIYIYIYHNFFLYIRHITFLP